MGGDRLGVCGGRDGVLEVLEFFGGGGLRLNLLG